MGYIPKVARGAYNWTTAVKGYLKFIHESYKQSDGKAAIEVERLRELKGLNDDREWESSRRRGLFIELALVEEFFDSAIPQWNGKIESIRNRLRSFLSTNTDQQKNVTYANECLDEILSELASTNPADFIDPEKAEAVDAKADAKV